jgi:hypothetical protein
LALPPAVLYRESVHSHKTSFVGLLGALAPGLLALVGCGSAEPKDATGSMAGGDSYLPLATGNSWSYVVTDQENDETSTKTQTVQEREPVPGRDGIVAYRMRTENGGLATVSWQDERDLEVIRYFEQSLDFDGNVTVTESYEPHKLRVDQKPEHTAAGATYSQEYTETHVNMLDQLTTELVKQEQWTVEAVAEVVTVPAGTFECLRLRRSGDPTQPIKTFFFARGIGKIRETGGQIEELSSYQIGEP